MIDGKKLKAGQTLFWNYKDEYYETYVIVMVDLTSQCVMAKLTAKNKLVKRPLGDLSEFSFKFLKNPNWSVPAIDTAKIWREALND